jgi:GntR family transcriptional regulator
MPDPMYRRIADDLRRKIESGDLQQGSQLPTEIELRDTYDASRNTVRDAVRWLATRGLVETRPGHGTFVTGRVEPFVTTLIADAREPTAGAMTGLGGEDAIYISSVSAQGRRPEQTVPRVEIQQASGVVARELGLAENATVVSRHQRRMIDGTPYSLQTTFYPMDFVQRGAVRLYQAEDILPGAVSYLEETLGIRQKGWRDRLTVRAPDANETAFFRLPDDGRIAVFETIRTSYDESGTPIRVTITTYPADRNEFTMIVGKVPADRSESIKVLGKDPEAEADSGLS